MRVDTLPYGRHQPFYHVVRLRALASSVSPKLARSLDGCLHRHLPKKVSFKANSESPPRRPPSPLVSRSTSRSSRTVRPGTSRRKTLPTRRSTPSRTPKSTRSSSRNRSGATFAAARGSRRRRRRRRLRLLRPAPTLGGGCLCRASRSRQSILNRVPSTHTLAVPSPSLSIFPFISHHAMMVWSSSWNTGLSCFSC